MLVSVPYRRYLIGALCLVGVWGCGDFEPLGDLEPWSLERELTIGSIDDSDQALTSVGSMAVDARGTMFLTQPRERVIRVFSSAGEFVRTVGRDGQGPGEFQSMGYLGWMADTLCIGDFLNQRVSLFGRDGSFVRSLNLMSPLIEDVFLPSVPDRMLPDGTALVMPNYLSRSDDGDTVTARPLFRIDTTGAVLLKLVEKSLDNEALVISMGTAAFAGPQPFGDSPLLAMPPDGGFVAVVERAVASEDGRGLIHVSKITIDGDTVFRRDIPYNPIPLPRHVVDSVLSARAENFSNLPFFESVREARQALEEVVFVPDFYPPVSTVRIGSDGRFWLKRENIAGPEARWDILSTDGDPIAHVLLPSSTAIHESQGALMWATERDELNVTYVVRYRIMSQ
ncbi:6-bladed beta-propeller [Gemmatimonadota bacterium]